ncbi:MAG: HesA/MoeB/ThiF family protein, partial [Duncaniella sp.]|nr:HesA/MoeB/ThiF family protein [Duncaniella sp.]
MDQTLSQRYRGHLSLCEIDLAGQRRLMDSRVLIVGAGGLGSPVALYLAAAGVGHITVIDPDTVSLSNLQRQIIHSTADLGTLKAESARASMLAINPTIEVTALAEPLTPANAPALTGAHDLVMDCTDSLSTRLLVSDSCVAAGKPYVFGAVRRFEGQLFTHQPGTAHYRTIFGDTPATEEELPCANDGVLNKVVGVICSLQATEEIKCLVGTVDQLT